MSSEEPAIAIFDTFGSSSPVLGMYAKLLVQFNTLSLVTVTVVFSIFVIKFVLF